VESLGCSSQIKKEREKVENAAGGVSRRDGPGGGAGPRRDGAGGKPRRLAAGSSKGSKRKAPPPAEDSSDEDSCDEGEEEDEDEAMQDAVSGSEDRFTDTDEVRFCIWMTQLRCAVITCRAADHWCTDSNNAPSHCTLVHWRHDLQHTTAVPCLGQPILALNV
jgi:hypothetical protein